MPVIHGDCIEVMNLLDAKSVDSIVTDPPAGISFMGKSWDHDKGGRDQWIAWMTTVAKECLRVIKPGGHALVWSLPRTSHWTATAWEDAGWEVRDKVVHVFGTGFPKSLNISKQLDKMAGVEREVVGTSCGPNNSQYEGERYKEKRVTKFGVVQDQPDLTAPATDTATQWSGYGTALKPAHEDWILLRKPVEGTIAQNVLEYGVGGINIDGCRVEMEKADVEKSRGNWKPQGYDLKNSIYEYGSKNIVTEQNQKGRFPANLIHDGSDEVLALFPNTQVSKGKYIRKTGDKQFLGVMGDGRTNEPDGLCDSGSAARFFYCAKPSPQERGKYNKHPTVKSIALMKYLCRLITPPNGIVLDPFGGSGSTAIAAREEGFDYILIEKEKESVDTANERLQEWVENPKD